jgi:hypothetical protein
MRGDAETPHAGRIIATVRISITGFCLTRNCASPSGESTLLVARHVTGNGAHLPSHHRAVRETSDESES